MSDYNLSQKLKYLVQILLSIILVFYLTACSIPRRVTAEQRMFLNLSVDYLGEYQLPKQNYSNTVVGGLSGITYNRQTDKYYVITDDPSQRGAARFYTMDLSLNTSNPEQIKLNQVTVEDVTFLKNAQRETYPIGSINPEAISLSPRNTLFIANEGEINKNINPSLGEYDLKTGQLIQSLRIPERFLPSTKKGASAKGIENSLGFESLTLGISSHLKDDPFRLFTATENALLQDNPNRIPEEAGRIRLLHYTLDAINSPLLVAEHLYLLEPPADVFFYHGLCELTAFEKEGYFLSLERTLGITGFGAKIFQVVTGDATDTTRISGLGGKLQKIQPMKKKLLLDLSSLEIDLDNLEAMTFGPRLPDGSLSLVVVSDDNFRDDQITQFLLFRVRGI